MRMFLAYVALTAAIICNIVSSSVLFFVPRRFRRRKDIRGQTVLITGAGSGVGRQLAIEFSKYATRLVLVDIDGKSLLQTNELLEGRSTALTYECDVSDCKTVYEMAKKVERDVGDVDILVNNAGIVNGKYLEDLSEEEIIRVMGVNALAHFWTCKAFLPAMMKKNRGHVVNILSLLGKFASPKLTDYCSSKFASVGFAQSLEMELRERHLDGIKVTIVMPTIIDTGLFQGGFVVLGPILTPEYVAKEVVLGILEEREWISLPQSLHVAAILTEFIDRWTLIKACQISGAIKGMEHFTGRKSKDL